MPSRKRSRSGRSPAGPRDVAAAGSVSGEALAREPGAEGDVLGTAELRRGELLAAQVGGAGDIGAHDQESAARGGASDDAHGLAARADERVDRRVGADVAGVERAREQRLDRGGAGVEGEGLELRGPELAGEGPILHADQRGGVGDVREVAEPQHGLAAGSSAAANDRANNRASDQGSEQRGGHPATREHDGRIPYWKLRRQNETCRPMDATPGP
nr:hypothetical protein [Nannocystis sp.]